MAPRLFRSFLMGGFEGSTHRRADGRQLDLLAATRHDTHAFQDFRLVAECGIGTVRDALRWHLIETAPGRYDWSSILPMVRAVRQAGVQPIWDLCRYGNCARSTSPHPPEVPAEAVRGAAAHREAQFAACDIVAGRLHPELGGGTDCLDLVGVNFYPDNQLFRGGRRCRWGTGFPGRCATC